MQAVLDHREQRPEESGKQSAICQKQIQVFLDIGRSIARGDTCVPAPLSGR